MTYQLPEQTCYIVPKEFQDKFNQIIQENIKLAFEGQAKIHQEINRNNVNQLTKLLDQMRNLDLRLDHMTKVIKNYDYPSLAILYEDIANLNVSVPLLVFLRNHGITNLFSLICQSKSRLANYKKSRKKYIKEIEFFLDQYDLKLSD